MSQQEPVPAPSLIDTDQMNESEKQLVELFESRATSSTTTDDGALASAEDLTEPTGTPSSTDSSTAAPEPATPVEGQVVGSESEPSSDPTVTTPVEGEPPSGEPVLTPPAFTFAGVDYGPTELAQAVQVRDWYQTLNEQQVASIDALLSGAYRLVPAHEADPVPPASASQAATSPAPSSPVTPVVDDDAGEWLDPRAQSEISRLQAEIQQMREQFTASVTPVIQSQQDQLLHQRLAAIDQASVSFQTEHSLDDDQMQALSQSVVQSNIFPSLVQRHNGNVEDATRAALDMMFWTTPTFRDLAVSKQATSELANLASQAQVEKQRNLTALANSSGGSVPRRDLSPHTKEDRHSAMVELIRNDMVGN